MEKDMLGEIEVPSWALYGSHTRRGELLFGAGDDMMPFEVVHYYALVKRAAAIANCDLGILSPKTRDAIAQACQKIEGGFVGVEHFPGICVFQTGSGTLLNMNMNEVIANMVCADLGEAISPYSVINRSQSSNDTFPTVVHIAAVMKALHHTLPALNKLACSLRSCHARFIDVIKPGRTHHMDALPVSLGSEFGSYASQIERAASELARACDEQLLQLPIGGTAVGTGEMAPSEFGERTAVLIAQLTGVAFEAAHDRFEQLSSAPGEMQASAALRLAASAFLKMSSGTLRTACMTSDAKRAVPSLTDISWMASGPEQGLHEIDIPTNEAGSSIMPGKANPTQCEALAQVSIQVIAHDYAIAIAASLGVFELNTFRPLICNCLLRSLILVGDAANSFADHCIDGIKLPGIDQSAARVILSKRALSSVARATLRSRDIGYEAAAAEVFRTSSLASKQQSHSDLARDAPMWWATSEQPSRIAETHALKQRTPTLILTEEPPKSADGQTLVTRRSNSDDMLCLPDVPRPTPQRAMLRSRTSESDMMPDFSSASKRPQSAPSRSSVWDFEK